MCVCVNEELGCLCDSVGYVLSDVMMTIWTSDMHRDIKKSMNHIEKYFLSFLLILVGKSRSAQSRDPDTRS